MNSEQYSLTEKNNKLCYETAVIEITSFAGGDVVTGSNDGEWDDD